MQNPADIEQVLRKFPQCHIYYHDNGGWIIYETRPMAEDEWLNSHPSKTYTDYNLYLTNLVAADGSDDGGSYVPNLVRAMAAVLGISTESV